MFSQVEKQILFRNLTVENGLSQNSVISIAQDQTGLLWFATQDGLNRFDGRSYIYFQEQFEDITRADYSRLGKIYIDLKGDIWIITLSGILKKFDTKLKRFVKSDYFSKVSSIHKNKSNNLFIGTHESGIYKINENDTIQILKEKDWRSNSVYDFLEFEKKLLAATSKGILEIQAHKYQFQKSSSVHPFSCLTKSADESKLFAGTFGGGLYYFDFKINEWLNFKNLGKEKLPDDLNIEDIHYDKNNRLWIATYGNGLYLLDFKNQSIRHFLFNRSNPNSISYNDLLCIFEDNTGTIWIGTDGGGVNYYDDYFFKFQKLTNEQVSDKVNLDVIRSITTDNNGNIWVGTSGKGLTELNLKTDTYKTYTTENATISSNRIISLLWNKNALWLGTQDKGLSIFKNGNFKNYDSNSTPRLNVESIWTIFKDSSEKVWLGTRYKGLVLFDPEVGELEKYPNDSKGLPVLNIRHIIEGKTGELWLATDKNGLYRFEKKSKKLENVPFLTKKIKSLYYQKERNILWVGTNGNGLVKYDLDVKKTKKYSTKEGLPNHVVYGILPDGLGNLWLSSNRGISKFNIDNEEFTNFTDDGGLQSLEFNTGAFHAAENGILFFGGIKGLNWFKPDELSFNPIKPKTIISQFKIVNQPQSLLGNQQYNYKDNTVDFTFSSLQFTLPERNLYKYKLENYDENWSEANNINTAHYTNLPPGVYTFKVVSSNYDGLWGEIPAMLQFEILKPWYSTNLAFILYFLILVLMGYFVYRYFKWRWKLQMQLEIEHEETERLENLNKLKTNLFNNISHEFRTPLTLISGPVENQLKRTDNSEDDTLELNLIKRNAKRLLHLINQQLEMAKLDTGQLKLKISEGNLNALLQQIIANFMFTAKEKNINFIHEIRGLENVWFDQEICEKILTNLLGNAVKYTPENGYISLTAIEQKDNFLFNISNSGNNLSENELDQIFDRYYLGKSNKTDGVGIGLSIVKELVTLAQGSIDAKLLKSDEICFTLKMPIAPKSFQEEEIILKKTEYQLQNTLPPKNANSIEKSQTNTSDLPKVLVVEDDPDMRLYIKNIIKAQFDVTEAENGNIGIRTAYSILPDLIISDIMMPEKTGIELCNELKSNVLTSHIPIIVLTAKSGDKNEILGLRSGADDYVTKPFNSEILVLKMENALQTRDRLKKLYSSTLHLSPELYVTSTEQAFLERLEKVVNENITDSNLTSEAFAQLMGMSRSQLHKKLNSILGVSTTEFIRTQRLKMAKELLKSDANISEIAYLVGFNSPSYFSKCFKEKFQCTPLEFQENRNY